ncbi:TPA: hypothetical protein PZ430_002603, partial [Staphylococcus aureus]|nr:hypothetical protein [Staphylococcus aureus]HDL9406956.1 hypothetical protein [Staphylococcus aureus]HDM3540679.1 hypothetical protein [Staphylococcus aureus]HDM3543470.1 hypothetical protein [Staphylococcus aureus]HDM3554722.1 hypothetical protein [Staphylococcus aureus]
EEAQHEEPEAEEAQHEEPEAEEAQHEEPEADILERKRLMLEKIKQAKKKGSR